MTHIVWYPGHELLLTGIVRAENCYLYDAQGKRYVDLESGVWCTPIGHGNPKVLRVIAEQAARIGHAGFCYSSGVVEQAAREILSLVGFEDGKCVFLCSGSEAVEYGVRVAQMVAHRPLLMTMTDSYFGAYGSASKGEDDEWFRFDWQACAACPYAEDCGGHCDIWATIPFGKIGGLLLEPGSSSGLVRFPPEELIRNIVRVVKETGGLVLVNEVTTGVGRTGTWFGFQHYGISPDIVAMGKGIGNGYPVSVTAISHTVIDRLGGEPVKYAQSHQNDPLGAAVVREVVRVIREEGLIERGKEIANVLVAGLQGIKDRTSRIKDIRSRGLMVALELEDDSENSFTVRTHRELVRRGFIVGRRPDVKVLRIDPSLTIEIKDIEDFLRVLDNVLAEAATGTQVR
ncbi:MAG: aminotransferase class III-fold pyridoxal phosphate-dependent enzyme [Phycisphaerae bacterium]|nr:aminotransferase class III-fold pyridoxal phosphate-dependent enzyme [Phycisphaerae bacterium]